MSATAHGVVREIWINAAHPTECYDIIRPDHNAISHGVQDYILIRIRGGEWERFVKEEQQ